MTPLQSLLAGCIRDGLQRQGSSQVLLAERAGISQKHLSQMLTGQAEGSLTVWNRLLVVAGAEDQFRDALGSDPGLKSSE